jgi:cytochrome P450
MLTSSQRMGLDTLLPLIPYGDRWRQARKQLHPYVHINAVATYQPLQLDAARAFAHTLLVSESTPEGLHDLIRANFAETIVKIVYGINATESAEAKAEFIDIPAQVLDNLNLAGKPDRFLVNFLPIRERYCLSYGHLCS